MGPYKPLRNWVDEFIPYYMEMSWEFEKHQPKTIKNTVDAPIRQTLLLARAQLVENIDWWRPRN